MLDRSRASPLLQDVLLKDVLGTDAEESSLARLVKSMFSHWKRYYLLSEDTIYAPPQKKNALNFKMGFCDLTVFCVFFMGYILNVFIIT